MNIHLLTPFPDMTKAVITESILGRAEKKKYVQDSWNNMIAPSEILVFSFKDTISISFSQKF